MILSPLAVHLLRLGIRPGNGNVRRLGGFSPRVLSMYISLLHRGVMYGAKRRSGEKSNWFVHPYEPGGDSTLAGEFEPACG